MPSSASARSTSGCTATPGALPAERASWRPSTTRRKMRSAITERPLFATQTKSTFTLSARLATTCFRCRLDHGQPPLGGHRGLARLDDRAVHSVCDLVGELDADVVEACRLQPPDVLCFRQCAGDAPDESAPPTALVGFEAVLGD